MLSDEQIWQLASQEGDTHDDSFIFNRDGRWSVLSFARAIESALSQSTEQGEGETRLSDEDRAILEAVYREMDEGDGGNAPGHCHSRPGIWDDDNRPNKAGKPCAWCLTWAKFTSLIQRAAMSPHGDGVNYTRAEGGEDGHPAADALRWAGFGPEDNQAMGEGLQDAAGLPGTPNDQQEQPR